MPKSSAFQLRKLNLFCVLAFYLHNKRLQGGVVAARGNALGQVGLDAVQGSAGRKAAWKKWAVRTCPAGALDQVADFDVQLSGHVCIAWIHGSFAFFLRTIGL
jgi:hypothetical protein